MSYRCPRPATLVVVSLILSGSIATAAPRSLTLQDRVAAQRAIEEVYWRHRIWPADNKTPKLALAEVLPDAAIAARVDDYLRASAALESLWHQPIGAAQLQAELDRMVKESRDPETLRELFAALGNDPFLIAECLARPVLVDRLIRNWYAWDQRFHAETREAAERRVGGTYREATWRLAAGSGGPADANSDVEILDADEWRERLAELPAGGLQESVDGFSITTVLNKTASEVRVATTTWPKQPFESWWSGIGPTLAPTMVAAVADYHVGTPASGGCTNDTWTPTLKDNSNPRASHVAVWTGTEMLVWGGDKFFNQGSRYNPSTDSWTAMSVVASPVGRTGAQAVWTGTEMIVWGGQDDNAVVQGTGGRYNPTTDTWQATSLVDAPTPRAGHAMVWTGTEVIVWAGSGGSDTNTGGRYNPVSDTWTPTGTTAAPGPRVGAVGVWTGSLMVVWGGSHCVTAGPCTLNTGGRYDPATDTWQATSLTNAPESREGHVAVWTGSRMVVWGGNRFSTASHLWFNSGGRYDPATDTWSATSTGPEVPSPVTGAAAVWTGSQMIVWGGQTQFFANGGGRYDPVADTWLATSPVNAPSARSTVAVWTGQTMIVFGGQTTNGPTNTGGRYDPVSNSWTPTSVGTVPSARTQHTQVWTGAEMIVWGGSTPSASFNTGARYNPAVDQWTPTTVTGAPTPRTGHVAVWTGSVMIVWSGSSTTTGGRYNPASDSWVATSLVGAPSGRSGATAVWTGTEMIVWGNSTQTLGGRYNPESDSWTPVSATNAPTNRTSHTAVWTGSEMIVWGGFTGGPNTAVNTGGRYSPATDSWTATDVSQAPIARYSHTAVWTGSRMIVWGGTDTTRSVSLNTGASYSPATNSWTPTTTTSAPLARTDHTAVWTGADMILWGGVDLSSNSRLRSGGRYAPSSDSWTATTLSGAPDVRRLHQSVWTGTEMISWGGELNPFPTLLDSGGRYCGCVATQTFYRDIDGDGFGVASATVTGCANAPLPGYSAQAGDCNDADSSIYPGAPQLCDGKNNNCSDPSWPAVPANEANADGDAFRICGGDCNDADSTVFPGAAQLCDGKNNNCSDPSWPAVPANEADADADGFRICQNDCNDANPAIRPNAVEVCNAIDDDCNAKVDDDALGEDTDGDGVHNVCDNCRTVSNPTQTDFDGDRFGNACDNCPSVANASQADADGDTLGDACDNCKLAPNVSQADTDLDRAGDACDDCLIVFDPDQTDFNADGEGDLCDLDDGLIYVLGTDDENYIEWQQETGPQSWNVYTGDLATLRSTGIYTQAPGSNPLASRTCSIADPFLLDTVLPEAGKVEFTLVAGVTNGVEGGLGTNSAGAPRPNTNPCP